MIDNQYNFTKKHTKSKGPRIRVIMKLTLQIIADARGVTKSAVKKAAERGKVDLLDIKSIAGYILGK